MELNWSTFTLEIINFLVLIWLLKRFLYKPVLNAIQERRALIQQETDDALHLQKEAQGLKKQYENRLQDWEQERQQAHEVLQQELESERNHQLEALKSTLAKEREKLLVTEESRQRELQRNIQHQALQQGAEFATRILKSSSGPELEERIIEMAIADLEKLDQQQIEDLQAHWGKPSNTIQVDSAYVISSEQQQALEAGLQRVIQQPLTFTYHQQPELIAGVYISVGAWTIQANIRDDLKAFVEFSYVAR